jgi:hypothetical protein
MTTTAITDHARPLVLQRDGACLREVVARRPDAGGIPARRPPRSSLRTLTNPAHDSLWLRLINPTSSIKESETPQLVAVVGGVSRW